VSAHLAVLAARVRADRTFRHLTFVRIAALGGCALMLTQDAIGLWLGCCDRIGSLVYGRMLTKMRSRERVLPEIQS
jgi:hypothetical protein